MISPKPPVEVASSGAGFLIPIEAGAWSAILERLQPTAVVGTSAGSIISALVAMGKTGPQLHRLVMGADFADMLHMTAWDFAQFALGLRPAVSTNSALADWLDQVTKGQDLGDCEIPLTCVCADVAEQRTWAFSTATTPDVPVALAVMASAAIPFVYPAVQWADKYLVDGGTRNNVPVDRLPAHHKRLGIMVEESVKTGPVDGRIDEAQRLIGMMLSANEGSREAWALSNGIPILGLPAGGLSYLDAGMAVAQREKLYETGYLTAKAFLDSRGW